MDDGCSLQDCIVSERARLPLTLHDADHLKGKYLGGSEAVAGGIVMMCSEMRIHKRSFGRICAILHCPLVVQNEC